MIEKKDDKKTLMFWKGWAFTMLFGAWFASGLFLSFLGAVLFFPFKRYREVPVIAIAKFWNANLNILLKLFCGIDTKIHNVHNIDFKNKKYIIAINHHCQWETLFFSTYFYPMSIVLKKELVYKTVAGVFLVYPYKSIPIDRKSFVKSFRLITDKVKQYLGEGRQIIIFPEGTRVPYGETKPLSKVVGHLAKANDIEILPIVHNAGKFWIKGMWTKFPGTIESYIGEPITTKDKTVDEIMLELEDRFAKYRDILG